MENANRRQSRRRLPLRQVYFIEAPELGRVKIGVATHAQKRLRNLQVGCPTPLVLRGVMYTDDPHRLERGYHATWAGLRIQGEWFHAEGDLAEFLETTPFEADLAKPPAAILFHGAPSGRRAVQPSSWAATEDELVGIIMRELEAA